MRFPGRRLPSPAPLVALLLASLLLAVAPPAHAQTTEAPRLLLEAEPFVDRVRPLRDAVATTLVVDADCALAGPTTRAIHIVFAEVEAPAWVTAVVSPPEVTIEATLDDCLDGRVRAEAQLLATANEAAPAFAPTPVRLRAEAVDALGRAAIAEAEVDLEARYFGLLDVSAPTTIRRAPPGVEVRFPVQLQNFGNGETRVAFERVDEPGALPMQVPEEIVLGSRQQGSEATSRTVEVTVRAPESPGPGTVTLRLTHASTQDPDAPPTQEQVTFLVEAGAAESDDPPDLRELPLPTLGAPVAVLLAALVRRAAQGRRHV